MLPKVVIVGRPNVGKSSLLNLIAGKRVSIVDAMPGVTRDRVTIDAALPLDHDQAHPDPHMIQLIDTGGHGIEDAQNLTVQVEQQIALGVAEADLILFITDAQSGILPLDGQVAQLLRTSAGQTPVLLVANKVDAENHESHAYDAMNLGLGEAVMISAVTGYNKRLFCQAIASKIDWEDPKYRDEVQAVDSGMLLAIVGKRNAGKSTLVNTLAGSERVIVSEIPGTTRDSIDVRFEMEGKIFTAIDTAGVRKAKSMKEDIEYYSHHRAMRSIRRAHVVLFMVDASLPASQVDSKLVNEVLRHYKPCIIVVNKWDLAQKDYTQETYLEYLDKAFKGLSFAPIVFVSATENQGVSDLVAMAMNLYEQANHRVSTGVLNRVIEEILHQRTPVSKVGNRPKVYYVTQLEVEPPTIALFVNKPQLFDPNYERFLINRLRDELPYSEVPIRVLFRGKDSVPRSARQGDDA